MSGTCSTPNTTTYDNAGGSYNVQDVGGTTTTTNTNNNKVVRTYVLEGGRIAYHQLLLVAPCPKLLYWIPIMQGLQNPQLEFLVLLKLLV
ncbi:MAG: hypothetical protein OEZ02_11785 [Anaerolineae bacterium]|nr:hypothetical protein [Anaerolineae bacterium]